MPAPAPSEAVALLRLAVRLRERQKTFFRDRDQAVLRQSKALEREFDEKAAAFLANVPDEEDQGLRAKVARGSLL
jgi:hypothetical protein